MPNRPLLFDRPNAQEVLACLTDFFFSERLQREADKQLADRKKVIRAVKARIASGEFGPGELAEVLKQFPEALNAVISLLGLSQERFLGILCLKSLPEKPGEEAVSLARVRQMVRKDSGFAKALSDLLMNGREDPELIGRVPPFDLARFDKDKLLLKKDALVDSLLRVGLKGRYDAKKGTILEDRIEEVLQSTGVHYIRGETRLPGLSRNLDFVIPSEGHPIVLIESGLFETTARELSDKARVESLGLQEIEQTYPDACFVRVTDGVGWKRRGGRDLANLIEASHYFLVSKTLDRLAGIVRHHVPIEHFDIEGT